MKKTKQQNREVSVDVADWNRETIDETEVLHLPMCSAPRGEVVEVPSVRDVHGAPDGPRAPLDRVQRAPRLAARERNDPNSRLVIVFSFFAGGIMEDRSYVNFLSQDGYS